MANEACLADHLRTKVRRRHCIDLAAGLLPAPSCPVVYFIGTPGCHVKIGFARDVSKRLGELQVGNPAPLTLLAFWPGSMRDERAAHSAFKHQRGNGEWFMRDGQIDRAIMSIQAWHARQTSVALPSKSERPDELD